MTVNVTAVDIPPVRTAGTVTNRLVADSGLLNWDSVACLRSGGGADRADPHRFGHGICRIPNIGDVVLADGRFRDALRRFRMQFKQQLMAAE